MVDTWWQQLEAATRKIGQERGIFHGGVGI